MAQAAEPHSEDAEGEAPKALDAAALRRFGVNAGIVAESRERYARDPDSVHPSWAALFEPGARASGRAAPEPVPGAPAREVAEKHARVLRLIHAYRARGHRIAATDPLGASPSYFPELDPAHYGLGREDEGRGFIAGDLPGGPVQPLSQILARLRATYCRSVGAEFTHVQDPGRKQWLQRRMEESENTSALSADERLAILEKLSAAELFERFLHTRFLGQKRFSLEGA
jgi:2-oxoglutarate dehydrogenase E1 component